MDRTLLEDSRRELVAKAKAGRRQKSTGQTRYQKRLKSRVSSSTSHYNRINMNKLFKDGILDIDIEVRGETDTYLVKLSFGGLLDAIYSELTRFERTLDLRTIIRAITLAFNKEEVYIACTCLHPDTRIKLLDGRVVTVEDMCKLYENGETLYVYSTDKNGDFKPGLVEKVWITKTTSEFIKITLDNGESIITTPDHPYMLRNGKYELAQNLSVGTSLMPLYTSLTQNGYETVKFNTTGRYHSTYKIVAESLKADEIAAAKLRVLPEDNMSYDIAIHHLDFIKSNNHPDNLKVMTAKEHWNYHNSLTFKNKPLEMQENIRKASRANALKRNANPTPAMLEQRKKFQEAGRLRNYDEDRKALQSEIAKKAFGEYYANLAGEELLSLSNTRSLNTKEAWKAGKFDTEAFKEAAKKRGIDMHTPEREALIKLGVQKYWANLNSEDREFRKNIGRNNLAKASAKIRGTKFSEEHKQKISQARLNRTPEEKAEAVKRAELTKIHNILKAIIAHEELISEETYRKYYIKGTPHYSKYFITLSEAASYYQINHQIVSIEKLTLPETPVYDIKVAEWGNFAVDAGVILHNCLDWKYRFKYFATVNKINSGSPEFIPSDQTNPDDTLGPGCKHTLLVLSNTAWIIKVASVITNYINYMKQHRERQYKEIIYPAVYKKEYVDEPTQLDIFDDELETDTDVIDKSNEEARKKGQFKKDNQYRFQPTPDANQIDIDDSEVGEEEDDTRI